MLDPDEIRLSAMLQELRDEYEDVPPYRAFQEAARDGKYRAKLLNGWWHANRRDKRAIAAAMRLKRRSPVSRGKSATSELTPAA